MLLILFKVFLHFGISAECPEKPNDYLVLPANPQSGNKYYCCNKEFGYDSQFSLTNSILSIYHCNFRNIVAIYNKDSLGIIKISIDKSIPSSLIGNINIEYCTFEVCYGAILIDSQVSSIKFNFVNCNFTRCQSMKRAAMIDFKAVNGMIDNCYFKDCLTIDSTSGYIFFNPPKIEGEGQVFTITNTVFDHSGQNSYAFLVVANDNCKLNFSKNKVIIPGLTIEMYVISYPNEASLNEWTFDNNCIEPYRPDAITNTNNQKIVNSFSEYEKDGPACPPILIPNLKKYTCYCYEDKKDTTNGIVSKNTLIALFNCTFTNVKSGEDLENKGGAVYICHDYLFDDNYLPLFVYNCSFEGCSANKGGAIYIETINSYTFYVFKIKNCKFTNNKCSGNNNEVVTFGGAVFINSRIHDFEFVECEFDSNEAKKGGAIFLSTSLSCSSSKARLNEDHYAL